MADIFCSRCQGYIQHGDNPPNCRYRIRGKYKRPVCEFCKPIPQKAPKLYKAKVAPVFATSVDGETWEIRRVDDTGPRDAPVATMSNEDFRRRFEPV